MPDDNNSKLLRCGPTAQDGEPGRPGHDVAVSGRSGAASGPRPDRDKRVAEPARPRVARHVLVLWSLLSGRSQRAGGPAPSAGREEGEKEVEESLSLSGKEAEDHENSGRHGVVAAEELSSSDGCTAGPIGI